MPGGPILFVVGIGMLLRAVLFGSATIALENNSPIPRGVQPPSRGQIRALPEVGGLHHRYQRVA
jgi:hypothetical protein